MQTPTVCHYQTSEEIKKLDFSNHQTPDPTKSVFRNKTQINSAGDYDYSINSQTRLLGDTVQWPSTSYPNTEFSLASQHSNMDSVFLDQNTD